MMTLPFAASTSLAALVQSRAGGGVLQNGPNLTGSVPADAQTGMPTGQAREGQPATMFSALVAAAMPKAAQTEMPGPAGMALSDVDAVSPEAALACLAEDTDALLVDLISLPGPIDIYDAVAQFADVLQRFDVATRGDVTEVFAANLAALDPEGLARLDAAAASPAALLTALAELADIPVAPSLRFIASPVVAQGNPLQITASPAGPRISSPMLRIDDAAPADRSGAPLIGRALVTSIFAGPATGAEREAAPIFAPPAEARAAPVSLPEVIRAADPAAPPRSGFARNVVQQIRGASFIDGHMRIALAPRGLGEIEIDMRADEAGKLRIVLRAENPAVLQALRGDRDGLLLALADSGAGVDEAELDFEDFSRRQQSAPGFVDVSHGRETEADPEEATLAATPARQTIGAGTLDILT